jgi:hypothetical protein
MEEKVKYIIIALVAAIVIMGIAITTILITNNGSESNSNVFVDPESKTKVVSNIFENNLKFETYDSYLYVYGFTSLTKKEMMDLTGYTVDLKVVDENGTTIDSATLDINEYIFIDGNKVMFGSLSIANAKNIYKVIAVLTDNNGNNIQTIEKEYY